jgi:WD40 repeat protein/tetratricopeptide (TPR) repeat protein
MPTAGRFYITGGTLPQEAASYVARAADIELQEALTAGEYCFVLNARQMGKSSLAVRTVAHLAAQGIRTAYVDLQRLGGANATPEQWYLGLLLEMGRGLGLRAEFREYWREHADLSLVQRVFGALREVALERVSGPIVVFVDEIDATRGLTFSTDEFFGALRECYNHRVQDPAYDRLTFCLVGSALPGDLIQDRRTSPFNIGRRIELRDFTLEEIKPLAQGLNRPNGEALLRRVCYWTSGHPYLTQSLCAEIAADSRVQTSKHVDAVVARLFFAAMARERNVNLADVANRILSTSGEAEELRTQVLGAYDRLLRERPVVDDEADRPAGILKLSGITRTHEGNLQVRNRIYRRVFDRQWVRENLPGAEVRRQRAAYRRGVLRTAGIALVMLAVVGGLGWKARQAAEESRQQLVRTDITSGMKLVEAGDALAALPWFLEALRLDQGSPERARADRLRLAMTAALCPRLAQVWFHDGGVNSVEISRDDRLVVTASEDKTARVWDLLTGKQIGASLRHGAAVVDAVFSPDGRRVATASADGTARVWETRSGRALTPPVRHQAKVTCVAFSPDGTRFATASLDKTARIWDSETARPLTAPMKHDSNQNALAFSADGTRLLITCGKWYETFTASGCAQVWDARTGRAAGPPLGHLVEDAEFSPDGRWVATASDDFSARVWDAASGAPVSPMIRFGLGSLGCCCALSPDGRLVTGTDKEEAEVWDVRTGKPLTSAMQLGAIPRSVAFSQDGNWVVTDDGAARLWNARTALPATPPLQHCEGGVRLTRDNRWLVTAGTDGTVRVWDLAARPEAVRFAMGVGSHAAFSRDGERAVSAGKGVCCQWDVRTGEQVTPDVPYRMDGASSPALSPDERRVVSPLGDSTAGVYDARSGRLLLRLPHPGLVSSAAFTPDGRRIVTSCDDGQARLWDVHTGKQVAAPWSTARGVERAIFSPDGRRIATVSGRSLGLWEAARGHLLRMLRAGGDKESWIGIDQVYFSADGGRVLATYRNASGNNFAQVWEVATGRPLGRPLPCGYGGDLAQPPAASFDSDGRRLLVRSGTSARIWDIATGLPATPPLAHSGTVNSATFSRDGRYVVTASTDGAVRIWDAGTGDPVTPPLQHGAGLWYAEMSPDGRYLTTGGTRDDGWGHIWALPWDDHPLPALEALVEVMTGRIARTGAGAADLDPRQFRKQWERVRATFRAALAVSPRQVFDWRIGQLRTYWEAGQPSRAIALLDRMMQEEPARRNDLLRSRSEAWSELGHWARALADMARIPAGRQMSDLVPITWYAALWADGTSVAAFNRLAAGDVPRYRQMCAEAFRRWGADPEHFASREGDRAGHLGLAAICTAAPGALPDMAPLVHLGEQAVARHPRDSALRQSLGKVLYRAHRYQEAAKVLGQTINAEAPDNPWDPLWLAMAEARVGRLQEARALLARYGRMWDNPGWTWLDRVRFDSIRREAEALVKEGGRE